MDVALNYEDCILYNSDLLILSSRDWLNDRLISFAFAYLQKSRFPIRPHLQHSVHFFPAEVVQLVKFLPPKELLETVLIPRGLGGATARQGCALLLPVNNNCDPNAHGGSHWSLLLYSWSHNVAFHYNSASGFAGQLQCAELVTENLDSAFALADAAAGRKRRPSVGVLSKVPVGGVKNRRRQSVDIPCSHDRADAASGGCLVNTLVTEVDCPQQQNSSDCGMFVIAYAEYLAQQITSQFGFHPSTLVHIKPDDIGNVSQRRTLLLQIILDLQKEGPRELVQPSPNSDDVHSNNEACG